MLPYDAAGSTIGRDVALVLKSNGCIDAATASSNNPILGSCVYVLDSNRLPIAAGYLTTGDSGYVGVHLGTPGRRFIIQANSAGTALTAAAVGENIDLKSNGFDTTRGIASGEADEANHGTGATRQLRILGLYETQQPYNIFESAGGQPTDWAHNVPLVVEINNYQGPPANAGV